MSVDSSANMQAAVPVASRAQVNPTMRARGLLSAAELAADKPCGTRVRYYAGCRCVACRAANTEYESERRRARRAGDHRGLVSAERARQHIESLRVHGIGWRTVADAAKTPFSTVSKILYGERTRVRAHTERRILQVTPACAADRCYVDAAPSWVMLDDLIACGWPRARLASEIIGHPVRALQLNRQRITVRNAHRVRQVWEKLRYADIADTRHALATLRELSEEGYHHTRVRRELDTLAREAGSDAPDMELRGGRMRQASVDLVAVLHRRLLPED